MKRKFLCVVIVLLSAPAAAKAEITPVDELPILSQALKQTSSDVFYTYDLTNADPDEFFEASYDPRKKPGDRFTVTYAAEEARHWCNIPGFFIPSCSSDPEPVDTSFVDDEKKLEADFWCSSIANYMSENVILMEETPDTLTYLFDVTMPPDEVSEDEDPDEHPMHGYVTVSKVNPAVLSHKIHSRFPFKPFPMMRISYVEREVKCERTPDGRTHMSEMTHNVRGEFFFKDFDRSGLIVFDNLKAVTLPAPTLLDNALPKN